MATIVDLPPLFRDSDPMFFLTDKLRSGDVSFIAYPKTVKSTFPNIFEPYEYSTFKQALVRGKKRVEKEMEGKIAWICHRSLSAQYQSDSLAKRNFCDIYS